MVSSGLFLPARKIVLYLCNRTDPRYSSVPEKLKLVHGLSLIGIIGVFSDSISSPLSRSCAAPLSGEDMAADIP